MVTSGRGSERKTDRLEAFSDAVLAIAITLPVIDLKGPDRAIADLAAGYAALLPQYVAYALSFVVIGLYWSYSHFSGKIVRKTDHGFNLLTLLFLACVSVTPFPTRPFVKHWGDPANAGTAATVYAGVLAAPASAWLARWCYAVWRGLLDPRLSPAYLHRLTIRYAATTAAALAGFALALLGAWQVGIALGAVVSLSYLAPPMPPAYRPGQEPRDELEEADEEPAG